jgi:hypothetical protein
MATIEDLLLTAIVLLAIMTLEFLIVQLVLFLVRHAFQPQLNAPLASLISTEHYQAQAALAILAIIKMVVWFASCVTTSV